MNTEFILQPKSGVNPLSRRPAAKPFGLLDGTLVLAFMVAFVALVFLLAH